MIRDEVQIRKDVMEFFDDPVSSDGAYIVSIFVFLCIVTSTITIILESLPSMDNDDAKADFFIVEAICITVFTLEYLVRIWADPNKCKFMIQPMNVVDLVAIMPFYIDIVMGLFGANADDLSLLRLLRLFRIFRIFKLSKYSSGITICASAIVESRDTLGLMIFMCSISVCIFSSFIFYFEQGEWVSANRQYQYTDGTPSPYYSIPAAMWWTMVTIMTVGYGDMVPNTWAGKLVAAICMVSSIVIMALPISVIGANFSRAWMDKKEQTSSGNDGRQLSYTFQNVLGALIKQNSMMEEVLGSSSLNLASMHKELAKARYEYLKLEPDAERHPNPNPYYLDSPESERLRKLVVDILEKDREMQFAMRKVLAVQQTTIEEQARKTLNAGKDLENYILRYQEISANIIGMEQVMFGRSLSVSGHR